MRASILGAASACLLAGCAALPFAGTGNATSTAVVNVAPALTRAAQSLAHAWTTGDVFEYDVTLQVQQNGTFVGMSPAQVVVLSQKGSATSSVATFANLPLGHVYQASVVAKGNVGGTAADQTLNASPATVTFDFSAANAQPSSQNVVVNFDGATFNGSQGLTITDPATDGVYINPTASESIVAGS